MPSSKQNLAKTSLLLTHLSKMFGVSGQYYFVIIRDTTLSIVFFCREQVVNVDLHDVFYLDSLPSSHPISTIIDNPTYQDNFDRISYGKGSVLIRMIEDFLTTEVFFKALGNYFKVMTLLDLYKKIFTSWTIILYHSSPKAYYYI
jgi:hypothetical protein